MKPDLGPQARVVYAALAEPGTAEDVADRTGLIAKSAGPHCSDLAKMGLVECVGYALNSRGKKVKVFAQVPPERVEEARAAAAGRTRRKPVRTFPVRVRLQFVRELFEDADLLEALDAEEATTRAEKRARRAGRAELRERERLQEELQGQIRRAKEDGDPRLPYWKAWKMHTRGADAARVLTQLLEHDVDRDIRGMHPLVEPGRWREDDRHTVDSLSVTGRLHQALRKAFKLPPSPCPACGAPPPPEADEADVVDGTVLEDLLTLGAGEN